MAASFLVKLGQVKDRRIHKARVKHRAQEPLNFSDNALWCEDPNNAEPYQILKYLLALSLKFPFKADTSIFDFLIVRNPSYYLLNNNFLFIFASFFILNIFIIISNFLLVFDECFQTLKAVIALTSLLLF